MKQKIWPNYYQLALMLGCDSLEHTQLVKRKILKYIKENDVNKSEEYLRHAVAAVAEIEALFKKSEAFDVSLDNIDVRNLNKRDMDAIVRFGINNNYILECLWNPHFYYISGNVEETPTLYNYY